MTTAAGIGVYDPDCKLIFVVAQSEVRLFYGKQSQPSHC